MEQNIKTKISAGMLIVVCCMVSVSVFMPPSNIQGQNKHKNGNLAAKEVYTGTAVAVVGSFGGASRPFTIEISGYTPDEEVQQDFQILRTQGQDDFMKAIGNKKLGFFALDGHLGRDINFVQESETENGRQITILFERSLNMLELRYGTSSEDFTYIELFVNNNGKGEGSMIGLAKVYFDKRSPNNLDIENFGAYPARLMGANFAPDERNDS